MCEKKTVSSTEKIIPSVYGRACHVAGKCEHCKYVHSPKTFQIFGPIPTEVLIRKNNKTQQHCSKVDPEILSGDHCKGNVEKKGIGNNFPHQLLKYLFKATVTKILGTNTKPRATSTNQNI